METNASPVVPSAQQFADILPIGAAIINARDEAMFFNRRFRDLTTRQSTKAFDCWSESICSEHFDRVVTAYHNALKSKTELRMEYRTGTDICLWQLLTLTPLQETDLGGFIPGAGGGFVCTITDITKEKRAEISQKKIAEEAQHRKEQQERFIDMISHEVRNPLSAILHCTEDILEAVNGKEEKDEFPLAVISQAAETISLCVAHQKKIVDDVLTFSKLDAQMLTLTPRRVQPKRHLATSLTMFRPELRKHGIQFEYKLDNSYGEYDIDWVVADLDRMAQVLVNLLSNSIKFTTKSGNEKKISVYMGASKDRPTSYPPNVVFFRPNEAALRLDATHKPEWGKGEVAYIMVAVKDTGIGISDEAQKRLFERFNQATPRTESIYGGSGLGLNVSRRLCHLHGGEIGVNSKEGEGSTFGFFFTVRRSNGLPDDEPIKRGGTEIDKLCRDIQALSNEVTEGTREVANPSIPTTPKMTHLNEVSPSSSKDHRWRHTAELAREATPEYSDDDRTPSMELRNSAAQKKHILVVEDNIINQRIVARKLQSLGYQVSTASNGHEALDAIKNCNFDCILMDQVMPVMDGNSATRAIRDLEAGGRTHIPVLGVTANVRAEQHAEMLGAGMDDVVHKPYQMHELCNKINQVTKR
ncbi:hypothetical protein BDV25DRAFT_132754 [Aspergillus avenaceus]|uniref:Histidine kinase G2 n=1 Tax=Aspergillus avenaceus TaxID=36643 RepID=A0A5N6TJX3_ASPAV|nr:hypothetical protein BDV25DRAFT_132754 [Aspergillus avenaceus]